MQLERQLGRLLHTVSLSTDFIEKTTFRSERPSLLCIYSIYCILMSSEENKVGFNSQEIYVSSTITQQPLDAHCVSKNNISKYLFSFPGFGLCVCVCVCVSPTNNIHESDHARFWIWLKISLPPNVIQSVSALFHQVHNIRHRQAIKTTVLLVGNTRDT